MAFRGVSKKSPDHETQFIFLVETVTGLTCVYSVFCINLHLLYFIYYMFLNLRMVFCIFQEGQDEWKEVGVVQTKSTPGDVLLC